MIKIGIIGAEGRMGSAIIKQLDNHENLQIIGAITHKGSAMIGLKCSAQNDKKNNVKYSDDLNTILHEAHVLIDFTHPENTLNTLKFAAKAKCAVVIGTTGFSDSQKAEIALYSKQIPVIFSANMSVGINVMYALLELATKALGNTADIEIIEMHHRNKIDSPSGTALKMGEVIADTLSRNLKDCAIFGREGTDGPRDQKTIGFATLRGGDVIGDHTAIFADIGERIEITHKATDRTTFANGAIRAALWLANKPNGLYGMNHVLGFDPV